MLAIGLMSGTSLDGVDAALVSFDGPPAAPRWTLDRYVAQPYTAEQRTQIHDAIVDGSAAALCRLHARLGEWFAEAALAVCREAGVAAGDVAIIGSHGQTVWHEPPGAERGATLQLGCPATIAERTGIAVVSDFRARDVAAGGQGAPLVAWADRVLFTLDGRCRVMQNIGGIANLTRLPPRGSALPVLAFDTGPGNVLIDAAIELATDGERTYDRGGEWGAAGTVNAELLDGLLAHPYFDAPPPKSTGRELFGRGFVADLVQRAPGGQPAWADLVATLTALTARSIAAALRRWVLPDGADEVVVTGGGARNPTLLRMLREALAPLPVRTGEDIGIDSDAKEAVAFAALAWAFLHGEPGSVPAATGARGTRVLGSLTPGSGPLLPLLRERA
jgi:anhydro-N-acetylmuramic acid kinase